MRVLLAALLLLGSLSAALPQAGFPVGPGAGQFPATATNDNGAAGTVGQYVTASTGETGQASASSTVTITIATPGVVTWGTTVPYVKDPNGVATCAVINFTTTGALPTGIVAGTNYYVIGQSISGNTFQIATTCDNAIAGTAIATSGTQSGTQTGAPTALLANSTYAIITGMSLPAGDWDVTAALAFNTAASTSITSLLIGTTTSNTSLQLAPGQWFAHASAAQVPTATNIVYTVGPRRYSLSGTTTIYCSELASFTVSTLVGSGGCRARRAR